MAAKKKSGSSTTKKSTNTEEVTPAVRRGAAKDAPVTLIDSTTARGDNDARSGQFAKVVSGKHQGRYGVFDSVVEYGDDGYPTTVVLVTRDEHAEHIPVEYADLRPAEAGYRGSFADTSETESEEED